MLFPGISRAVQGEEPRFKHYFSKLAKNIHSINIRKRQALRSMKKKRENRPAVSTGGTQIYENETRELTPCFHFLPTKARFVVRKCCFVGGKWYFAGRKWIFWLSTSFIDSDRIKLFVMNSLTQLILQKERNVLLYNSK